MYKYTYSQLKHRVVGDMLRIQKTNIIPNPVSQNGQLTMLLDKHYVPHVLFLGPLQDLNFRQNMKMKWEH